MTARVEPSQRSPVGGLLDALSRLDERLQLAVDVAAEAFGAHAIEHPLRGMSIGREDLQPLFERAPGEPAFARCAGTLDIDVRDSPLGWLAQAYELTQLDIDLLVVAIAPDLDTRYERIYAFLQDDVTRKRPSVDLALNLLCASTADKLAARHRLSASGRLLPAKLLWLDAPDQRATAPLLSRETRVDEQVVSLLTGHRTISPRFATFSELVIPVAQGSLTEQVQQQATALARLAKRAAAAATPLGVYLQAPTMVERLEVALAAARQLGLPALCVDLARARTEDFDLLLREAWFLDAVPVLEGLDAPSFDDTRRHALGRALQRVAGIVLLGGTGPMPSLSAPGSPAPLVVTTKFAPADFDERRRLWKHYADGTGLAVDDATIGRVAGRLRMNREQIAHVVAAAALAAPADAVATERALFDAARERTRQRVSSLVTKVQPVYRWDDIVLAPDTHQKLREICRAVTHRHTVMEQWGFGRKLSAGKGLSVLFSGEAGTGKTMAAEVIANELGFDLYRVELANVVSKYIGDTEKNLETVFSAVEESNAILFFDEADAIFGKRSEVRDARDRYANLEISYVLMRMESYDNGVCILATNLPKNMDAALLRRLGMTIPFPIPSTTQRRLIWQRVWPDELPLAPDIPFDTLAERFRLNGGNIKNIALAASYLAAEAGQRVASEHILASIQREYQKMGKQLSADELRV